jgi:organic hydroperoxide reductase OsmC/OhrA
MTTFPNRYVAVLSSQEEGGASLTAGARPAIRGGPPPEFGGKEGWWSPEHLLVSALNLCLMATFEAFAAKAHLAVRHYDSLAEGVLDKTPSGLAFTSFMMHVRVEVEETDVEAARRLLETAKKHCIVAGALKKDVELSITVSAPEPAYVEG